MTMTIDVDQVRALIGKVSKLVVAERKRRDDLRRTEAPDFNVLDLFGPGENQLSYLLAYFLDPEQGHGQGDAFLRVFLHSLTIAAGDRDRLLSRTKEMVVRVEKSIANQRRLDVSIELMGKEGFEIAIENKFGAADQSKQMDDYQSHLQGVHPGSHHLVYLTPDGTLPSEASWSAGKSRVGLDRGQTFQLMSYRKDVAELLEAWERAATVPRIASFLREIAVHIETRLNGGRTMKEFQNLALVLGETPESIAAAVAVSTATTELKLQLIARLANRVRDAAGDPGLTYTPCKKSLDDRYWSIAFRVHPQSKFTVEFQFGEPRLNGLCVGISLPGMNGKYKPSDAETALVQQYQPNYQPKDGWWACQKRAPQNWRDWEANGALWAGIESNSPQMSVTTWMTETVKELLPLAQNLDRLHGQSS